MAKGDASDDNDLGEMDTDDAFTFGPAERKLITQPYDLSIQTLVEQWNTELLILPEIQRQYVWDNGKASRLIESLLLNIPIPVLYFAETPDSKYEVIDGHQRVKSVARFVGNEFRLSGLAILREYMGKRFHQLPDREQRLLKMRTLRAVIISVESSPNMKFEIFERLNTGAVSLNAQELRNSIYRGDLNRLLHELAKDADFRAIIGSKSPRQRMVDEELVLRFFALHDGLGSYRSPLKRFLNDFMHTKRTMTEPEVEVLRELFQAAIGRVRDLLGDHAFRLTDTDGNPVERSVNRALYDAQLLVAAWTRDGYPASAKTKVRAQLAETYESQDFLDSIQRATGDRARTFRRVHDVAAAFQAAGLIVTVPFDFDQ